MRSRHIPLAAVLLLLAIPAAANQPLVPLPVLMGLPTMAAFRTAGISLAGVTVIELLVLMKRERLALGRAFHLALAANLVSTLIGIGMLVASAVPIFLVPGSLLGAWAFSRMLRSWHRTAGVGGRFATTPGAAFAVMLLLCLGSISAAVLFPQASVAAAGLLVTTGFAITVLSEGEHIARQWPKGETPSTLAATVVWMNVASYLVLVAVLGTALYAHALSSGTSRGREASRAAACEANLRQIAAAKETWALDHRGDLAKRLGVHLTAGTSEHELRRLLGAARPTWSDLSPRYLTQQPTCPAGGAYALGSLGHSPTCSAADPIRHTVGVFRRDRAQE